MRILVASADYYPTVGSGVAKAVLTEVQALAARGHETVVLTRQLERLASRSERFGSHDVHRYTVPPRDSALFLFNPLCTLARLPQLAIKLHRRHSFDVSYVHNPYQAVALQSLTRLHVPTVYVFHFPLSRDIELEAQYGKFGSLGPAMRALAWLVRVAERRTLQGADAIVVHSEFMRVLMQRTCGDLNESVPVKVLPLAVDTQRFAWAGNRAAVRRRLNIPRDRAVLLTVRRLVGRMGLANLIDAMELVVERNRGALLLIGGTGYLETSLQERVLRKGLERHVHLLGFIPEEQLAGYYQAADLFVLPTEQMEGFGLVTIESLSCGTPVIATPVGANPEVVGPLDPAFLSADASPEALAERINWWLDRGVSGRLRQACREYCVSRFAIERVVASLEEILAEAAESAGAR